MKKAVLLLALLGLVMFTCSKKNITNNYYYSPEEEGASIVGVVYPPESNATVTAYAGILIAITQIDSTGCFILSGLPSSTYSLLFQAEGYHNHSLNNIYVKENLVALSDTIHLFSLDELINSVSPSDGQQGVDVKSCIRFYFLKDVNQESLVGAISFEPSVEGGFLWLGTMPRTGPTHLEFCPRDFLATNTSYHVTIDTTASDVDGMKLKKPYEFSFTTEPLMVDYTSPSHNEAWVSSYTTIRVSFNASMVMESVESAFSMVNSLNNEVGGDFRWRYSYILEFLPRLPLAADEQYTVMIDPTASDTRGTILNKGYYFSFFTQPVMVSYVYPQPKSIEVSPTTSIRIRFNTDMIKESTSASFQLLDSQQKQVSGELTWIYINEMIFRPDTVLNFDETYTIMIDNTAEDIHGKNMDNPFSCWFKTASQ